MSRDELREHARKIAEAAPPLTDNQRERLRNLLAPVALATPTPRPSEKAA